MLTVTHYVSVAIHRCTDIAGTEVLCRRAGSCPKHHQPGRLSSSSTEPSGRYLKRSICQEHMLHSAFCFRRSQGPPVKSAHWLVCPVCLYKIELKRYPRYKSKDWWNVCLYGSENVFLRVNVGLTFPNHTWLPCSMWHFVLGSGCLGQSTEGWDRAGTAGKVAVRQTSPCVS